MLIAENCAMSDGLRWKRTGIYRFERPVYVPDRYSGQLFALYTERRTQKVYVDTLGLGLEMIINDVYPAGHPAWRSTSIIGPRGPDGKYRTWPSVAAAEKALGLVSRQDAEATAENAG